MEFNCGGLPGCISPDEVLRSYESAANSFARIGAENITPEEVADPTAATSDTLAAGMLAKANEELAERLRKDPTDRSAMCAGPLEGKIGAMCIVVCPYTSTGRRLQKLGLVKYPS